MLCQACQESGDRSEQRFSGLSVVASCGPTSGAVSFYLAALGSDDSVSSHSPPAQPLLCLAKHALTHIHKSLLMLLRPSSATPTRGFRAERMHQQKAKSYSHARQTYSRV